MPPLPPDALAFYMSTEQECLTCVPEEPDMVSTAIRRCLQILHELAPSLPGPSGLFNGYGRIYVDCGHIELAAVECHSPYVLPLIIERQHELVRIACDRLFEESQTRLIIACNNHSGVLTRGCPVWGAHENHTVTRHPSTFGAELLPFLITRLYGGAGGIEAPSGRYLAGVRPTCMELATGGDTTRKRSIHSTSREEHHMGRSRTRFRYHLILGDGHRSHFNTALQFGATALAIKAAVHDPELKRQLATLKGFPPRNWVTRLNQLNILQRPDGELRIDPVVVDTQRVYLEAARRFAECLEEPPGWIPEILQDWEDTLDAMARLDRDWLAARLDTFAKYELYSAVLEDMGVTWRDLPNRPELFAELALHDHSYHSFSDSESVFSVLEEDGLLDHRVGTRVAPGEEPDPFVPELATRAQARARFIKEHANEVDRYMVDWQAVLDLREQRMAEISDPGATEFSEWQASETPEQLAHSILRQRIQESL